ncbi:hypothetical protein H4582DRAFT_1818693 [Lactarius indigo]|nr:hypothetical protein H4582DRAFT_1818693 [Lactarius indigo]
MTDPLPQWLVNSFLSVGQPQYSTDESVYYGPYYLFGIEGQFEISFRFHVSQTLRDSSDVVALFTVELNKHPVFFIQVHPPATFILDSKRRIADDQMRDRFRDFRHFLVTPRLPGISALGTRMAFYEYVVVHNGVTQRAIVPDPEFLNDVASIERWNCDNSWGRRHQSHASAGPERQGYSMCQALDN